MRNIDPNRSVDVYSGLVVIVPCRVTELELDLLPVVSVKRGTLCGNKVLLE